MDFKAVFQVQYINKAIAIKRAKKGFKPKELTDLNRKPLQFRNV